MSWTRVPWLAKPDAAGRTFAASDARHGTSNGYINLRCRCAECRTAQTVYLRVRNGRVSWAEHVERLQARPVRHGTLHAYKKRGCRCDECKRAVALERRRWRRAAGMKPRPAMQKYPEASGE